MSHFIDLKTGAGQTLITEDGSPSLLFTNSEGQTELMHNQRGALSETIYIYGEVLELLLSNHPTPNILNVGLGLGYSEFLCAALSVKYKKDFGVITSFEKEESFIREFLNAVESGKSLVLESVARATKIEPTQISQKLKMGLENSSLKIFGALDDDVTSSIKFEGILYDPFSEKMTSQFWTEDWLNHFLSEFASDTCILASYAAKGVLNRALKKNEFSLAKRVGFGGKKQCTLAFRRWTFARSQVV